MSKKRTPKVESPKAEVDHDLETWAKLGSGVTDDDDGMTEGERIVARGNKIIRRWLNPTRYTDDEHENPFIQPFI